MGEYAEFEDRLAGRRGTGRTTRTLSAAIAYASSNWDKNVLVVASDHQHKKYLQRLVTLCHNIHVCTRYDIEQEKRNGYDIVYWDHYAAEAELAKALVLYETRLHGPQLIDNTDYSEE